MSNDINWEGLSNALRVFVQALSEVSSIATTTDRKAAADSTSTTILGAIDDSNPLNQLPFEVHDSITTEVYDTGRSSMMQAEFKTDKNKLSVWKVENEEDLLEALIALGSNCDNIGTIEAVKIDEHLIDDLTFDMEEGDSPTIGINENHRNIIELNYISLGEVIKSIINGIQNGYVRKTKGEMKKILANAYLDSKLDIKKLKPSMYSDIQKAVASRAQDR